VPRSIFLKLPYLFYIGRIVPLIGQLFLENPANYRLLGIYTESFGTCQGFLAHCVAAAGLTVRYKSYFLGCATAVVGEKPSR
jgi:ubiquinone/menaquinone biosynthesis C-methylase UbiE